MQKYKKSSKVLWILAAAAFLIAVIEGCFYWEKVSLPLFRWEMILDNAMKAFLFNPSLGIGALADSLKETTDPVRLVVGYAYGVSVMVAPLCTVSAMVSVIRSLLRSRLLSRAKKYGKEYVIIGFNENVKQLLKHVMKDADPDLLIRLLTPEELPEELEVEYLRHNILVHKTNIRKAEELPRGLDIASVDRVFLMDASDTANLSTYLYLKDKLGKDTGVYCFCESDGIRQMLETYADPGLVVFSGNEFIARKMFEDVPLGVDGTHLLILGCGRVGSEVLSQAVNIGTVGGSDRLIIDVVDHQMLTAKKAFESRFRSSYIESDDSSIRIAGEKADGELLVRFHSMELGTREFRELLQEISADMPVSYCAICVEDADTGMQCLNAVLALQHGELDVPAADFPIVLRLEYDESVASVLAKDEDMFANVHTLSLAGDVMTMDNICEDDTEKVCIAFNAAYDALAGGICEEGSETGSIVRTDEAQALRNWQSLVHYKRESNRCLAYHDAVKRAILRKRYAALYPDGKAAEAEQYRTVLEPYFGPEGSVFKSSGGSYVYKDEETVLAAITGDELMKEMVMLEHRRWNYFMAMQGWGYTPGRKQEAAKLTPYLTNFDILLRDHASTVIYDLIPLLVIYEQSVGRSRG